jgi:NhaA family Na+:H+ antiporter
LPISGLILLNLRGVTSTALYVLLGIVLWVLVLKSGVHATLAGVITALAIPLTKSGKSDHTVLENLEHRLHPWVAYGILPLFAFANSGVSFAGLGLFAGKQIGVFGAIWLTVKLKLAKMPDMTNWAQIYGIATVAGIGFTMSLFIGSLAFSSGVYDAQIRLGVLIGSVASALVGYIILRQASKRDTPATDQALSTQ